MGTELAIYVRELDQQSQYYTITGNWVHKSSRSAYFFVPGFVHSGELDGLRPFLPAMDIAESGPDQAKQDIPRSVGAPLIQKMWNFWMESETAYRAALFKLDNAHQAVADQKFFKYATLEEIADMVLPRHKKSSRREASVGYPKPVLYALHRALSLDDVGFRPQRGGTHRTGGQYEISPLNDVECTNFTVHHVRKYQQDEVKECRGEVVGFDTFREFVGKLQSAIDMSRKARPATRHGTLGPLRPEEKAIDSSRNSDWKQSHLQFLHFLESWAALSTFPSYSTLNGIGSAILRATKRYESVALDRSTAWTMLQEIGFIPPWQNRSVFDLRLPGAGAGSLRSLKKQPNYMEDSLASVRTDFETLPVYCIDAKQAHEIDDGVSLEHTDIEGEYWVHIHTADPGSRVDPKTNLDNFTRMAETIYLPEKVYFMLSQEFVQANLSLDRDRPTLTFSAKMNVDGVLLESRITPGIIQNVKFLTPETVNEIITGVPSEPNEITYTVGNDGKKALYSGRLMTTAEQLADSHKDNLRILNTIGEARKKRRVARGGLSIGFKRTEVSIPAQGKLASGYDPEIHVTTNAVASPSSQPTTDVVAPLMLLAAEVAAQWCQDRGIPIPYRVTPPQPGQTQSLRLLPRRRPPLPRCKRQPAS